MPILYHQDGGDLDQAKAEIDFEEGIRNLSHGLKGEIKTNSGEFYSSKMK